MLSFNFARRFHCLFRGIMRQPCGNRDFIFACQLSSDFFSFQGCSMLGNPFTGECTCCLLCAVNLPSATNTCMHAAHELVSVPLIFFCFPIPMRYVYSYNYTLYNAEPAVLQTMVENYFTACNLSLMIVFLLLSRLTTLSSSMAEVRKFRQDRLAYRTSIVSFFVADFSTAVCYDSVKALLYSIVIFWWFGM